MSVLYDAFLQELRERFSVHRIVPGTLSNGFLIYHIDGTLHYANVRFADQGSKVYVHCHTLNRRYQECHELSDPQSIEKILEVVRRHLDGEISQELYV